MHYKCIRYLSRLYVSGFLKYIKHPDFGAIDKNAPWCNRGRINRFETYPGVGTLTPLHTRPSCGYTVTESARPLVIKDNRSSSHHTCAYVYITCAYTALYRVSHEDLLIRNISCAKKYLLYYHKGNEIILFLFSFYTTHNSLGYIVYFFTIPVFLNVSKKNFTKKLSPNIFCKILR